MSNANNIEIELKFTLGKEDLDKFLKFLEEKAKFKFEKHQIDYYLDNPRNSFVFMNKGFKDATDYLRIRTSKQKSEVCFKHWVRDSKKDDEYTHCEEYETQIEDAKVMLKLFESIGFTHLITIDKLRKIYNFKDFEISVDKVKGLGDFFEIELKKEVLDPREGLKLIENFLKGIGINKIEVCLRGYVSMLLNPDKNFRKLKILK